MTPSSKKIQQTCDVTLSKRYLTATIMITSLQLLPKTKLKYIRESSLKRVEKVRSRMQTGIS